MYKSIVMHELDFNYIAPCEEWYYRWHGPQLARRYGPWLERFESYRPVPLPADFNEEEMGYTNWLTTVGYWREIPEEGAMGEMSLSSPVCDVRNFAAFLPPQYEDDFKGAEFAPEEKSCLRLVQFFQYPEEADKEEADRWFREVLSPAVCNAPGAYRFFSSRCLKEEIHLPGNWKPEKRIEMMEKGNPEDRCWDRVAQLWFETFDDVRRFFAAAGNFPKPGWRQRQEYPYLESYDNYVSTFLLERPAFDWLQNYNVYR